jgi:hypothetical protein
LIKVKRWLRHLCDQLLSCGRQERAEKTALPKRDLRWLFRMSLLATLIAVVAMAFGSFPFPAADSSESARSADLGVVYIGADDCGPCLAWRRAQRPQFLSSPEFARVRYREIISPRLLDLPKEEHWPDGLRKFREEFDRLPGAPMWFVVHNDRVVVTARGLREWQEIALPRLKSLVR